MRAARARPAVSSNASSAASSSETSHAARTSTSQSAGAASPAGASSAVIATGSGFHDGPLETSSPSRLSSRPHTSQAQAS